MMYECPKCKRFGMEWDGRAKVIMCYYNTCNHVIRIENQKSIPSPEKISEAIKKELSEIPNETPEALVQTYTSAASEETCAFFPSEVITYVSAIYGFAKQSDITQSSSSPPTNKSPSEEPVLSAAKGSE